MRCASYDRNLAEILVDSDEGAALHASARKYLFPAQVSAGLSVGRANATGPGGERTWRAGILSMKVTAEKERSGVPFVEVTLQTERGGEVRGHMFYVGASPRAMGAQ